MTAAGKSFLVCAYSSGDAEPGFLKAKVRCCGSLAQMCKRPHTTHLLTCCTLYQVEALGAYLATSLDHISV